MNLSASSVVKVELYPFRDMATPIKFHISS